MTSKRSNAGPDLVRIRVPYLSLLILCTFLLSWSRLGFGLDEAAVPEFSGEHSEVWLVTFGPGENYWERFGHNAIWLREPDKGLDHTFNFGFFDFEQEDFFLRFLRGRMLYFSVAQPADREFEFYRQENRSIRIQKLNLNDSQYVRLRDYLLNEIQPQNRDYRYDYYLNNCSTRIRDALDIALDGGLSARTKPKSAELNFREQTRRLTEMEFWYYMGLELVLGYPVDRAVSRWDEMFIPMVVADEIAALSPINAQTGRQLVSVDSMLFTSTGAGPADSASSMWYRFLLLGLLIAGAAWLSGKFMPPLWLSGICSAWVLICVTGGLILASLWLLTDHEVTRPNANLLLLNPLLILALIPSLRRIGAVFFAAGVVLAVLLILLPTHQYNLDVLALLAPINLTVAAYLFRISQDHTTN
jgi:hypothetical protein